MIDILANNFFHPDRLPLAVLVLALTGLLGLLTGPLAGSGNPLFWSVLDTVFGPIGRRLDRRERPAGDLVVRGFILVVLVLAVLCPLAVFLGRWAQTWPIAGLTTIVLLAPLLAGGAVFRMILRLHKALQGKKIVPGSYYNIVRSTRIDLAQADDYTITRTGMGYAARLFDKAIVGPVFWYVVGGLPAAYIYAGLSFLAWRFGKDGYTKGFGRTALVLERIAGFVPQLIAGFLVALAGLFTPTAGIVRGWGGLSWGEGRAPYEEGGLPVSAMAWALRVSLNGPVQDVDGSSLKRRWVGPEKATAQLESGHLRRALYMMLMAYVLLIVLLMGVALLMGVIAP